MNIKKQLISMNYSKGKVIVPLYIVIHETANTSKGANAQMHYKYWDINKNAQSSVHFVVDDKEVVQLAEFEIGKCWRCWHVGDNKNHSDIINSNSIGIEICVNSDGDYTKARQNTIELVKYLMPLLNIKSDHVVRHFDSSGKHCPVKMLDKPELWTDFKKQLEPSQINKQLEAVTFLNSTNPAIIHDVPLWIKKSMIDNEIFCLLTNMQNYIKGVK